MTELALHKDKYRYCRVYLRRTCFNVVDGRMEWRSPIGNRNLFQNGVSCVLCEISSWSELIDYL